MNKVQESILKNVVNPAISKVAGLRIATLRTVDYVLKTATITFDDNKTGKETVMSHVPMIRQQGMHESGPFEGDQVVVGFFNNDIRNPVIIGSIDLLYPLNRTLSRDKHSRKGSNVTDLYASRKGEKFNVGKWG